MKVAPGIILAWPGSVATIPANWDRVAALDAKFPRGAAVAGGTGGAATHVHTAAHTHNGSGHTHDVGGNLKATDYRTGLSGATSVTAAASHSHTFSDTSSATTINGQSTSPTIGTASNVPPYLDVIWIDAATARSVPASVVAHYYSVRVIAAASVPGAERAAGVVTIITTTPHHLVVGDSVEIAEVTNATFDGTFAVATVPSATSFTHAQAGADAISGGGKMTPASPRLPIGWTQLAASKNKFLRGATAGAGGGGTGGVLSHTHTNTTHHHATSGHSHAGTMASSIYTHGTVGVSHRESGSSGAAELGTSHSHDLGLNGGGAGTSGDNTFTISTDDMPEPPWCKLAIVQNTSGNELLPPAGLIGLWTGLAADIPDSWLVCDGTNGTPDLNGNVFVKGCDALSEVGDTGGSSATHTHTAGAHTHAAGYHAKHAMTLTHNGYYATYNGTLAHNGDDHDADFTNVTQTLTGSAMLLATPTMSASSTTPFYYDVIYVMFAGQSPAFSMCSVTRRETIRAQGVAGELHLEHEDIDGAWTRINSTPSLTGTVSEASVLSLARTGGQVACAIIKSPPGGVAFGFLARNTFTEQLVIDPANVYTQVEIEAASHSNMMLAMLLGEDEEMPPNTVWYQTCGQWNAATGKFVFVAPVPCPPGPVMVTFPYASDVRGSLRKAPDGAFLFAIIDIDGYSRLFRCASMPKDATGTWEEI